MDNPNTSDLEELAANSSHPAPNKDWRMDKPTLEAYVCKVVLQNKGLLFVNTQGVCVCVCVGVCVLPPQACCYEELMIITSDKSGKALVIGLPWCPVNKHRNVHSWGPQRRV